MSEPIETITWNATELLNPNGWNPNRVMKAEMALLKHSLLSTGWIQPILVNRNNMIIDGFHRWSLACVDDEVRERWGGKVPCATLPVSDVEAKVITVRINRAKGTHIAVGMSKLVKELVKDDAMTVEWVAEQIGADKAEVAILLADNVFEIKNIKDWEYSQAWYPTKT